MNKEILFAFAGILTPLVFITLAFPPQKGDLLRQTPVTLRSSDGKALSSGDDRKELPQEAATVQVVATFLSWAGCSTLLAQPRPPVDETLRLSQVAPPPPAPVPPNASRVITTVLKHSVWPVGSLRNTMPPVSPDQTFYSLTVEIHISDPENSELDSLARPGIIVEAFSSEMLASDLVGKKITATLKLTGDTRGVRWWISNVRVLP